MQHIVKRKINVKLFHYGHIKFCSLKSLTILIYKYANNVILSNTDSCFIRLFSHGNNEASLSCLTYHSKYTIIWRIKGRTL
jgi:hypothetical protein